eukprot:TRINITY_DN52571_c0_g1_i1.p1 TRINITY_DN52571_c0_g1~~TRINITY_DN52571_c0_g1_i1.p1  ORF type:complete len:578 (-),score=122.34 TRINITY_DN52571_c0_g1_i1:27-1760(-)
MSEGSGKASIGAANAMINEAVAAANVPSDPAARVEMAERHRSDGNEKFKLGDHGAASTCYKEALRLLENQGNADTSSFGQISAAPSGTPNNDESPELTARKRACLVPTKLNLALCCLKATPCDGFYALRLCEEVLDVDPDNVKAVFRKAKALIELDELKEADWELVRACKLSPKDVSVRQELENLRRRVRDGNERQKQAFEGLFDRNPGFVSAGRQGNNEEKATHKGITPYAFLKNPEENSYASSEKPAVEEALELAQAGRFEEAIWALEAGVARSKASSDWPSHFGIWLELGRLFMDLNNDGLALRCLNNITRYAANQTNIESATVEAPPPETRQHALLLSAICLLNEAQDDPEKEVSDCINEWLVAACPVTGEASIESKLERWRVGAGRAAGADAAIAHCLFYIVSGRDECLHALSDALAASEDDGSFFGDVKRRAMKWNMLGAVLANRSQFSRAKMALQQALALQPNYPRALNNLGISLEATNDFPEAARMYIAAMDMVPAWAAREFQSMLERIAEKLMDVEGMEEAVKAGSFERAKALLKPSTQTPTTAAVKADEIRDVLVSLELAKGWAREM